MNQFELMLVLLLIVMLLITVLLTMRLKLMTGKIADACRKDVEIMVLLKYLHNFWTALEIPLINCEINLIFTWSDKCVLSNDTKKASKLAITDAKT